MKYLLSKPSYGRRVQVYRNLHNGMYSVRCAKTRRVIHHVDKIYLQDVRFKVSQSGRNRVLREKRKNVHAVVEGTWLPFLPVTMSTKERIRYNPYLFDFFYTENPFQRTVNSVFNRDRVIINDKGVFA